MGSYDSGRFMLWQWIGGKGGGCYVFEVHVMEMVGNMVVDLW